MMNAFDQEQLYFDWLCSHIEAPRRSYAAKVAQILYAIPFTPQMELDDNRYEDGMTLRQEYTFQSSLDGEDDWGECSFLEMLIALSERMGLQIDMNTSTCFWHLMGNLGPYTKFHDPDPRELAEAAGRVNNRTFEADGHGGLFPLELPPTDQRDEQIYRQMQLYILELDL